MKFITQFVTWQLYVHYLLLAGVVFFVHHLSDIWGIEAYAVAHPWWGMPILFLFYAIGLLVFDVLLVGILSFMEPKETYGGKRHGR